MTEGPKHDVFISFARGDRVEEHYVRAIVGLLRGYGLDVCHDETHAHGKNLTNFMREAVETARWVLPILTPKWKEAFDRSDQCENRSVAMESEYMRDRQAREGTWDKWTVPLRLPGVPPKAAPAALNYLSCELPTQGKDLLENLDRPSASNAPDTLAALFALARTSKWDSQTHRAFIVQSSIDSYTETLGSPFEYQHEHPLARWARRLSSATRHDPNALRRATEAILDAFADGGLPPGAFGEWAKEMYEIDPTAPRRPWVLRLTLSADGLRFTSGMWIRADLARTPVAPSLHYDELADAWRTLAPPPGAERDQSLLILDVPLHAPSRLDQSTPPGGGRCLREDWRAVAYWPRKANGPLEAQSCPGRGHCRFRPKMPRAEHEHLQLLEGTNLAELSSRHDGHVLTVGAVEPEHFARGWRDANGYASTRDVFLRVRESVAAGKDALLIWTDKAYELLEPWEP